MFVTICPSIFPSRYHISLHVLLNHLQCVHCLGVANVVYPNQTVNVFADWSVSTMFVRICTSIFPSRFIVSRHVMLSHLLCVHYLGEASIVYPDQTVTLFADWSMSTMFVTICPSIFSQPISYIASRYVKSFTMCTLFGSSKRCIPCTSIFQISCYVIYFVYIIFGVGNYIPWSA